MSGNKAIKNQLRWRCRRGMQEMDILLLRFLDEYYDQSNSDTQTAFADLLQEQDDVLWDWLSGRQAPTNKRYQPIVECLLA